MQLSSGALLEILNGTNPEKPILQVINVKKITAPGSTDRYRLLMSDGNHTYSHAMLAAQMNKFLEEDQMRNYCIIEVKKYMCNTLGEKKVIIILDLAILDNAVQEKIGSPQQLSPTNIPKLSDVSNNESVNAGNNSAAPRVNGVMQPNNAGPFKTNAAANNSSFKPSVGGGTPGTPGSKVHGIASLTPYQNRWRIRARVTQKSGIRTWSNSRGEGKLFSVNLLDDSGEIRATGFNDQVDKYYDMLEVNKVYYFSKCTLKTANKQYSNLKNEYEMTMNPETIIDPCNEDTDVPVVTFDFVKLSDLEQHKPKSNVDVCGVVNVCNDLSSVVSKATQKEITKREVQIVDQSGVAVRFTLWGDEAQKFQGQGFPVLACKGASVSDFGGRSLSASSGSSLMLNPDIDEAHKLRGWWDTEGRHGQFSQYQNDGGSQGGGNSNWKIFSQIKNENLGQGDKADYYTAKGTVIFCKKDNCMYRACPTTECNKKLIDQGNGLFRCEKCSREFPNYKWRMILSVNVADHSDNQWITCFQESAETLLNVKADDLGAMREQDEVQFDAVFREALFKQYTFRMRAKMETYNDESRLKTVCVAATPLDWLEYGQRLTEQLEQLGV